MSEVEVVFTTTPEQLRVLRCSHTHADGTDAIEALPPMANGGIDGRCSLCGHDGFPVYDPAYEAFEEELHLQHLERRKRACVEMRRRREARRRC